MRLRYLFFTISVLSLLSCSMKTTQLSVIQPGQLDLPTEIKTIATMDRSLPPSGFVDVLEGAVTGEGIGQDRAGRREALEAVEATLRRSPRYQVISTGIEEKKERQRSDFDPPLPDDKINELCRDHRAEALLVLEYYDSDHSKDVSAHREKNKAEDGSVYYLKYFVSDISSRVILGWRLYYTDGRILDEHSVEEEVNYSGRGDTEGEAMSRLPSQRETVIRASRAAGIAYGGRIAPLPKNLNRRYYSKAAKPWKDEMKKASRSVETGDWDGAATIWKSIYYKAEDDETKGRTAYNLALAGEAKGQFELAKYWAKEAFVKHGLKKANAYIDRIEERIRDRKRLEKQLD